jgi:hypothetical protein
MEPNVSSRAEPAIDLYERPIVKYYVYVSIPVNLVLFKTEMFSKLSDGADGKQGNSVK